MQMDIITELLNFPDFKVTHMDKNPETRMEFILSRIKDLSPLCSGCGRVRHTPIHSLGSITVEHLPKSGKMLFIQLPVRKQPCIESDRILVEELS